MTAVADIKILLRAYDSTNCFYDLPALGRFTLPEGATKTIFRRTHEHINHKVLQKEKNGYGKDCVLRIDVSL
jgi:hypothetical protein